MKNDPQTKAPAQLDRSESELGDILGDAAIGIHWLGPDGTILWANQAQLDLLGYTAADYVGHSVSEFHTDERARDDLLSRLKRNETVRAYKARLRAKDGSIKHVLISSNVVVRDGEFVHARVFTKDITEGTLVEEQLSTVTENIPVLVSSIDRELRYQFVNRAYERWFGRSREEIVGKTMSELIGPAAFAIAKPYVEAALRGEHVSFQARLPYESAAPRDVRATYIPHTAAGGGFVALVDDVSEQVRTTSRLQFTAEASKLLASSLDYEVTLTNLTKIAVPHLADWCAVDIVEGDGSVRQLAVAHVDPSKVHLARELRRRYPPDPNAQSGAAHFVRTKQRQLFPSIAHAGSLAGAFVTIRARRDLVELESFFAMLVPRRLRLARGCTPKGRKLPR